MTVDDYDEKFIQDAVAAFRPLMEGRDHDEYLAWRDWMQVLTRSLKQGGSA